MGIVDMTWCHRGTERRCMGKGLLDRCPQELVLCSQVDPQDCAPSYKEVLEGQKGGGN